MKWWTNLWDSLYSISSGLLAFLLGVVLANILQGMPLDSNYEFTGNWLSFLNPFSIMVGLTTLFLLMMHGTIYLTLKTEGRLFNHVEKLLRGSMIGFIFMFGIITVYTLVYIPHLSDRFREDPILFILPILVLLSIANIPRLATARKYKSAFIFSSATIAFLLMLVAVELYPNLLMATNDSVNSITIYKAASSDNSLGIMLTITAIGAPLVLAYTFIVYKTFWGKVNLDETSY